MLIKDVLIGVGIAWLSLTPQGKKMRDTAIKKITETYLLPKEEEEKEVKKDDARTS